MAEGTSAFLGRGVGLVGEYEIKQKAGDEAVDILSLTGSTGTITGDFLVAQTGAGTEVFVVSASGLITSAAGFSLSGVGAFTLSSSAANAIQIAVTTTGAIAAGTATASAVYVYGSSKSVLNSVIMYVSTSTGGEVSTARSFLAAHGSKAPSYLLSVGATAIEVGAATDNGLVETATRFLSAPSTAITYGAVKCLFGSKVYYLLAIPDTSMADT